MDGDLVDFSFDNGDLDVVSPRKEIEIQVESSEDDPKMKPFKSIDKSLHETPPPEQAPVPDPLVNFGNPGADTEILEPMKFGDIISLNLFHSHNHSGFVSAEPCFERVGFTQTHHEIAHDHWSDCLFQVCPMLSYDNKASKAKLKRR